MEVDSPLPPPSMDSLLHTDLLSQCADLLRSECLISPSGPATIPSAGKPGEDLLVAIRCENARSAFASLQRTLTKSNLKSIKPRLHPRPTIPTIFCYILSSEINRFPHIYKSISKNWISIEQSRIGEESLPYPN